jgi:hypothetical protein
MPVIGERDTEVLSVRIHRDLMARIDEFANASGMDRSKAARVLLETGLDADIDPEYLGSIYFNAKSAALEALDRVLTSAVDDFKKQI